MRSVFAASPSQLPETEGGWRWWLSVWLPVALALMVIAIESTVTFSAQNTSSWLRPVFEYVAGPMRDPVWETVHHYIRKTGHFVGYGTVGFTFLRAWLHTRARGGIGTVLAWRVECSVLAILSTAVVASLDEYHQSFLPGRTGVPSDVLLDTCGACTLCLIVWLSRWRGSTGTHEPLEA
jgi:VanZ family protein